MVSLENTLQTQTLECRISKVLLLPLLLQLLLAYKTFCFKHAGARTGSFFECALEGETHSSASERARRKYGTFSLTSE